ncbi:hypothetical protein PR048_029657 [Dryococelus australis]|uniref:Uncharacterized protein n=1 Tax=Dryococelus australis TaxID=614101 RepID=A0ABQ9GDZ7_9NEOP|nr:hypothetical protein PR048_029657 [Dryococelus australis]
MGQLVSCLLAILVVRKIEPENNLVSPYSGWLSLWPHTAGIADLCGAEKFHLGFSREEWQTMPWCGLLKMLPFPSPPSFFHCSTTMSGWERQMYRLIALGFLHVGTVPDDVAGWQVFSGISHFPRPCILALLHTHFALPSSACKTSISSILLISSKTYSAHLHADQMITTTRRLQIVPVILTGCPGGPAGPGAPGTLVPLTTACPGGPGRPGRPSVPTAPGKPSFPRSPFAPLSHFALCSRTSAGLRAHVILHKPQTSPSVNFSMILDGDNVNIFYHLLSFGPWLSGSTQKSGGSLDSSRTSLPRQASGARWALQKTTHSSGCHQTVHCGTDTNRQQLLCLVTAGCDQSVHCCADIGRQLLYLMATRMSPVSPLRCACQ